MPGPAALTSAFSDSARQVDPRRLFRVNSGTAASAASRISGRVSLDRPHNSMTAISTPTTRPAKSRGSGSSEPRVSMDLAQYPATASVRSCTRSPPDAGVNLRSTCRRPSPEREQPDIRGVFESVFADELPDRLEGSRAGFELSDRVDQNLQATSGEAQEKVLLRRKVAEERPSRHSSSFGDLVDCDFSEAALGKEGPGDLLVIRLKQASPPIPAGFVRRDGHGEILAQFGFEDDRRGASRIPGRPSARCQTAERTVRCGGHDD